MLLLSLFVSGEYINQTLSGVTEATRCFFERCKSKESGGALYITSSVATVKYNTFAYCSTDKNGGALTIGPQNQDSVVEMNCGYRCSTHDQWSGQFTQILSSKYVTFLRNAVTECNYIKSGDDPVYLEWTSAELTMRFNNMSNNVNVMKSNEGTCSVMVYTANQPTISYCSIVNNSNANYGMRFRSDAPRLAMFIIFGNTPVTSLFSSPKELVFISSYIIDNKLTYSNLNVPVRFSAISTHMCYGQSNSFTTVKHSSSIFLLFLFNLMF